MMLMIGRWEGYLENKVLVMYITNFSTFGSLVYILDGVISLVTFQTSMVCYPIKPVVGLSLPIAFRLFFGYLRMSLFLSIRVSGLGP